MSRAPDLVKREAWRRRLRAFDRGTATVEEFGLRMAAFSGRHARYRRSNPVPHLPKNAIRRGRKISSFSVTPWVGGNSANRNSSPKGTLFVTMRAFFGAIDLTQPAFAS